MLAVAGTIVAVMAGGVAVGIGFLIGSLLSAINFWFWHRLVERIGTAGKSSAMSFGARYMVFGLAGYAIFKYSEASFYAVLAGFFVTVAAVILKILFELIYGT